MKPNPLLNPVDWFNFFGIFREIFQGQKNCNMLSDNEACLMDPKDLDPLYLNKPSFILGKDNLVQVVKNNSFYIAVNIKISKFMLLTAIKFKGNIQGAMSYVSYNLMKQEIPYIRVGCDYMKVFIKRDRYGGMDTVVKGWKKEEIKQDHDKNILNLIPKYDDFCIVPDNINYKQYHDNCYNLYSKFSHKQFKIHVLESEIPASIMLLNHIFGEQIELGLRYFKILYEFPQQILPVLVPVSYKRGTGKTTLINWIQMIFGQNTILASPDDLTDQFNASFATKNIIIIDEAIIEKSAGEQKIKSISTAKSITYSEKFIAKTSIPFFGKLIFCSNKVKDFMRIDEEEVRYWIREIPVIKKTNVNIEDSLFAEIPKFLRFLSQLPDIDFSKSRMVFTKEEIHTEALEVVVKESYSWLRKELEIILEDFFHDKSFNEFEATAIDVYHKFFLRNNKVSAAYLRSVIKDEMKLEVGKNKKYQPFRDLSTRTGRPFLFKNTWQQNLEIKEDLPF